MYYLEILAVANFIPLDRKFVVHFLGIKYNSR
jgi:hypothetical protein